MNSTPTAEDERKAAEIQVKYPGHTADVMDLEHQYYSFHLLHKFGSARVITWTVVVMSVIGLLILFLPWQQNIQANGFVTALHPGERPQQVTNAIPGMIAEWYVDEGEVIKKGQPILRLTEIKDKYFDTLTVSRLGEQVDAKRGSITNINDKIVAQGQQLQSLREGRTLSYQKAQNKVLQADFKVGADSADYAAAVIDNDIARTRFERQEELYDKGLVSLRDLESRKLKLQETEAKRTSARNKLGVTRNEYINAKVERESVLADYDAKIAKTRSEIDEASYGLNDARGSLAKLENERSNTQARVEHYIVRAPQDGQIIRALKAGIGEIIKEGEPVVTIMPRVHTTAVELFIDALDVPLMLKGTEVRLQFDGWPVLVFAGGWPNATLGTFGGKVIMIEDAASQSGKYRVLVGPDPREPWPDQLRMGSGALGWAMLTMVPVWYEVWRQFNGFPPDLKTGPDRTGIVPPVPEKSKDKKGYKDASEEDK